MKTSRYSALKDTNLPNEGLTESAFMRKVIKQLDESKRLLETAPKKEV